MPQWIDLGPIDELSKKPLQSVTTGRTRLAVSCVDGRFGVINGVCNHAGGPLGDGRLDGEYIVCPWHNWKFHRTTGVGEPGFEEDRIPRYESKVENGHLLADLESGRSGRGSRIRRTRWRDRSNARPVRFASSASRRRTWTSRIRATRRPTRCSRSASLTPRARLRVETQLIRLDELDASGRARATTRRARTPAPGPARSRRWIRTTSWRQVYEAHRALGRRDPGRDADPLGQRQLALLQDGRADELRAEPGHDRAIAC